jgi:hypothetical protein
MNVTIQMDTEEMIELAKVLRISSESNDRLQKGTSSGEEVFVYAKRILQARKILGMRNDNLNAVDSSLDYP